MNCNNDYRHVCFKDLENYFRKDLYFSDLTPEEKALVLKNLGIQSEDPSSKVIIDSYDNIRNAMLLGGLNLSNIYIINDFKSIYEINGEVLGNSKVPSTEYYLILRPSSSSSFDKRVSLASKDISNNICQQWSVEYDITREQLSDGTYTKGKITYMKDQNNNSAYYDFKNIKFKRTSQELNKGQTTYNQDQYFYTFDIGNQDASNTDNCKNNTLEAGVFNNVFLGKTQNNKLAADCHSNTFFNTCENNTFYYGTRNNYFINDIRQCTGAVHDKELTEIISMSCPKSFNILNDTQVLIYLDSETQTFQIKNL